MYRCRLCKRNFGNRKEVRLHIRKEHGFKGKRHAPGKAGYMSSEISPAHEYVG